MLTVEHVTKKYGDKRALDDINFFLKKGTAVGFLGPNGAGKSTTMNIITGYISATEGVVKIDGVDIDVDPIGYKKKIGYLPEVPPLYLDMTLGEYLGFIAGLKSVSGNVREQIDEVLEMTRTTNVRDRLIKNLSRGYRQRCGFAQALLGKPSLLILDEPTIGLDPSQIVEVRALLNELKKDHTIFLSSHILSEITEVCDRVILLNEGKIIANDTQEALTQRENGTNVTRLRTSGEAVVRLEKTLMKLPGVVACKRTRCREPGKADLLIESVQESEVRDIVLETALKSSCPVFELAAVRISLEDVFIKLTGKKDSGADTV